MPDQEFPIGGSRQAVYDALRSRGFVMSGWSDKAWTRRDGLTAHVYGAGSKLEVRDGNKQICDCLMADALKQIDALDRKIEPLRDEAAV